MAEGRIETKWVGGAPAWAPAMATRDAPFCQSLLHSLDQSLSRGHGRVAVRRFLVMTAWGVAVPDDARAACERVLASLSRRELTRVQQGADRWATLIRQLR